MILRDPRSGACGRSTGRPPDGWVGRCPGCPRPGFLGRTHGRKRLADLTRVGATPILSCKSPWSVSGHSASAGVFRYAERLVSHQAAFRSLVDLRVALYERLIPLAPAGLPAFKRGDLLRRMVDDVETMSDLSLRVMLPIFSAILVGTGSVILTAWLLPASGVILAVCLLLGGIAVPALIIWSSGSWAGRAGPFAGRTVLGGADRVASPGRNLWCSADDAYGRRIEDVDARLAAAMRKTAVGSALSTALGILVQGAAVIGMILVAVPAVRAGDLWGSTSRSLFSCLWPRTNRWLCSHPRRWPRSGCERQPVAWSRSSMRSPRSVNPSRRKPPMEPRSSRGAQRLLPTGPVAVGGVDFYLPVGHRIGLVGESGSGKSTVLNVLAGFLNTPATCAWAGGSCLNSQATTFVRWCCGPRRSRTCSTPTSPRIIAHGQAGRHRRATARRTGGGGTADGLASTGRAARCHALRWGAAAARAGAGGLGRPSGPAARRTHGASRPADRAGGARHDRQGQRRPVIGGRDPSADPVAR